MPIQNAEDLFFTTLSHLYSAETRTQKLVEEMAQTVQDKEIKEWLELRAYFEKQEVANLEECFRRLGKQPVKTESKWTEVVAENARNVLNEIQSPQLKGLFLLHSVRKVQSFHIAEYGALATMAELAGYPDVAALLERNKLDKVAYVERSSEMLRNLARQAFGERVMRKVA